MTERPLFPLREPLTRIFHGCSSRSGVNVRGCKAFTTEGTADVLAVRRGDRGSVTLQTRAVTLQQQKICEICGLRLDSPSVDRERDLGDRFWVRGLLPALGAGLLLRLWYFLDLVRQPFFGFPIVDSLTYDRLATEILAGGTAAGFFRPPLYPFFLSATYLLVGHHQAAVVWVQFLLGLATVVPVFLLAERWFGGVTAAVAAGSGGGVLQGDLGAGL